MTTKQGCGTLYGNIKGVDELIGNMYRLHQNPYKRYFTQDTEGERFYFENLADARNDVISNMRDRVDVTEAHIKDELSLRTIRGPREKTVEITATLHKDLDIIVFAKKRYILEDRVV